MTPTTAPACNSAAPSIHLPLRERIDARGNADKVAMQHTLFSELSRMFAAEVPMYDKSLLVNAITNRAVCDLLGVMHPGFAIDDATLERTSGERHGAIRIGRPDEYRWIGRFFAQFAMEPHNFYDMTSIGAKSQPIIATAFRSRENPEHRVFTSLIMPSYFDDATAQRIQDLVAQRQVFSDEAKALIEKGEREGGLTWKDADALIREATTRIFKWTGKARDHAFYKDLSASGFKIVADIVCFERHHLNHLTPNTFCMDLYTAAMKHAMGELDASAFAQRAKAALTHMLASADRDYLRLTFRHLKQDEIDRLGEIETGSPAIGAIEKIVAGLVERLLKNDVQLRTLKHSGFKDFTEGPSKNVPVLLRQDAYKALTEQVLFTNPDGSTTDTTHTARFGEIEQRFYACTPAGRELYDRCLTQADAARDADPSIVKRDFFAYERQYGEAFKAFPTTLQGLIDAGMVYAKYSATPAGIAQRGSITTHDIAELQRRGLVRREGLRYEDFLPVSAAGIFASNLNQYGTASTARQRPTYTQQDLEAVLGRTIVDASAQYAAVHAQSLLDTYASLGLTGTLPMDLKASLEKAARGGQCCDCSCGSR